MADRARWWELRPAQGAPGKTYTCPLCHGYLLAMNPNILMSPEGDRSRRRHAHTACVAKARAAGTLLTRSEWEKENRPPHRPRPARRAWWRRLLGGGDQA
jgi:hypothetical protein